MKRESEARGGDPVESTLSEQEALWARRMTELLGGLEEDPYGINGCVDGYRSIRADAFSCRELCVRLPERNRTENARTVAEAFRRFVPEILGDRVGYELTADAEGMIRAAFAWPEEDPREEADIRRLARAVTILLEQENGAEILIGIGVSCKSPLYLPFSGSYAMQHLTRRNVSPTIRNVLTEISVGYSNPELSVGRLAGENYLSYSYLCTQFKREVGMTLREYILRFRMRTAAQLLSLPTMSVEDVSREVGYPDVKTLTRHFRKAYGTTPQKWREKTGNRALKLTKI